MTPKQIARLMKMTTDVSTKHCLDQHQVKDGFVWRYDGWLCWGIHDGKLSHDDIYEMTTHVDLKYVDIDKLRVYKEVKRW